MLRKALLAACVAALATTPAWAAPPAGHGNGHGPQVTPPPVPHGHGNSHKCKPHKVGYVAAGLLVSQTLAQDTGANTFSGDVVVDVKRTNHHGAADKGKTVTYSVAKVRVTFGLADTNSDGTVGLDDLAAGDRVRVIGKITAPAKKCDAKDFTPTTTIRKVVFHAPKEQTQTDQTQS